MKAIILAGGKGTRLYPYTAVFPKPLMPLGNMPILELVLRQLASHGFSEITLAVNHLHHLIRAFFGDGSALGLNISYVVEDKPMGTCGPLADIIDGMSEHFLVMNGDVLTSLDYRQIARSHATSGASITAATYNRVFKVDFGVVNIDSDGRITEFSEKPSYSHNIGMGIYVLSRDQVRSFLTPGVPMDMPDLIKSALKHGVKVNNYTEECVWLDIGKPEDYAMAQDIIVSNGETFLRSRPGAEQDSHESYNSTFSMDKAAS